MASKGSLYGKKEDGKDYIVFWADWVFPANLPEPLLTPVEIAIERERVEELLRTMPLTAEVAMGK